MNKINVFANKMFSSPAYHAQIELAHVGAIWFYGYQIQLIESWVNSPIPLPENRLPSDQRGAVSRDLAIVLALFEISKMTAMPEIENLDEIAVWKVLIDECRNKIHETATKMLINDNAILRKDDYARAKLSHILSPKMMQKLGNDDDRFSISIPKTNAAQPALF